ncbi:fatty acid coa synthetase family [Anaeramoeba flamelloides]|uniref:Fatty acid coa synthetase family n=1 Tax=Anaeramoeba flamelloides TaxID=1746091 RepID=A0AAV8AFB5_9EUKA|nr:fatty acid coa synthetase family [Anaeramoeba flamelloides]
MTHIPIIEMKKAPEIKTEKVTIEKQKFGIQVINLNELPIVCYCDLCQKLIEEQKVRYVCTVCDNFDVCKDCYLENGHDHPVYVESYYNETHQISIKQEKFLSRMFEKMFNNYHDRPCVGIFNSENELIWYKYRDIFYLSLRMCKEIKKKYQPKEMDFVIIASENRLEWLLADVACTFLGIATIPLMVNEPIEKIKYIYDQIEGKALIICSQQTKKVYEEMNLPNIWLMEDFEIDLKSPEVLEANKDQIQEKIDKWPQKMLVESEDETVYTIMFTSGTTGTPKGAVFHHSTWKRRVVERLGISMKVPRPYCIYEFTNLGYCSTREAFPICLFYGGRFAMSRGVDHIFDEVKIVNPTFFSSTPRLYEVIYSQYKDEQLEGKLSEKELNAKYRQIFGNRVKMVVTGGAKTSKKIMQFLKTIFKDIMVKDSFGATECGSITTNFKKVNTAEIKLIDCPEMNYFVSEGYGEICVKSKEMINGYYKNEQATKENFTKDGYFKTGDIGKLIDDQIQVVDRIKFTIKLSQGVFLNLNYLEEIFKNSEKISQIFIYSSTEHSFLVAIVVPEARFQDLTKEQFLEEINRIAQENDINSYEIPRDIYLELKDPFSQQNGLMTVSAKKNRSAIYKKYKSILNDLFEKKNTGTTNKNSKSNRVVNKNESVEEIILDILNLKNLNEEKSIHELGGDSLTKIRLRNKIKKCYGILIPKFLYYLPSKDFVIFVTTPEERTRIYQQYEQKKINWETETTLPMGYRQLVSKEKLETNLDFRSIFLTGSTGFLGSHILFDLLQRKNIESVYCLIRGADLKSAKKRLNRIFKKSKLKMKNSKKVHIILGDLTKSNFGMPQEQFETLAKDCDLIIHSGTHVDSVLPYSVLKGANVYGTKQVIKMASLYYTPIIYISTLSVFFNSRNIKKSADPYQATPPKNASGYPQSKWVAENLIHKARSKYNLDIAIFRPASIFANSKSGYLPEKDLVFKMLAGLIKMNLFLKDPKCYLDLIPVDFCSKTIIDLSFNKFEQIVKLPAIPLANPSNCTLLYLLSSFEKTQKISLNRCDYDLFRKKLNKSSNDNPLNTLKNYFLRYSYPKLVVVDCSTLLDLLEDEKVPMITQALLGKVYKLMRKLI